MPTVKLRTKVVEILNAAGPLPTFKVYRRLVAKGQKVTLQETKTALAYLHRTGEIQECGREAFIYRIPLRRVG